ncbi:hypothetical protein ACJRO7_024178 [Eucalyptus globulus]|uniref:Squalene monooxygenase n=1 Tax=Eucalyptus globulus TaxID=34317 RepID=A0ABD3K4K0_EUCGL
MVAGRFRNENPNGCCWVGGILASVLGVLFLYRLVVRKRRRNGSECVKGMRTAKDEESISVNENGQGDLDVIVVGAGVAGSALAYTLGKDGRRVRVIERDLSEPDRIVGELLQPGGYLKLIELGLEDCVEKIDAQQVFGYALFKDGRNTRLSYPLEMLDSDVSGRSFHNVASYGKCGKKQPLSPINLLTSISVQLEQGTVTSLLEDKETVKGIQYKTKTGQELKAYAPLTVVCDGCFSNLRCSLRDPKVDVPSWFVGLVLENSDPSPILFYPISSTEVRCLVDVLGQKMPSISNGKMANYLKTLVAPQVPPEILDAFIAAVDRGNMPTKLNRSMPAAPNPTPGALLMGDAFNMRHPLTGGGMTVALSDIVMLRDLLRHLRDLNVHLLSANISTRSTHCPVASTMNTLAGALYKVFCALPDKACYDYLCLGGLFSSGPISLLSSLNSPPLSLVLHFFEVAIYGGASGIIFLIIRAEWVRQMFFPATVRAYYQAPPIK